MKFSVFFKYFKKKIVGVQNIDALNLVELVNFFPFFLSFFLCI